MPPVGGKGLWRNAYLCKPAGDQRRSICSGGELRAAIWNERVMCRAVGQPAGAGAKGEWASDPRVLGEQWCELPRHHSEEGEAMYFTVHLRRWGN